MRFQPQLFRSFFLGGFECSTHRRADGRRLDMIAATHHDALAEHDYAQLREHGILTARDGVRWHLIETVPGFYDWSSILPLLRAAETAGIQVIWDLCHYGWPDWLDIWSAAFPHRFARFAAAFTDLHLQETGRPPQICPINEISFLSWAGGEFALMNPLAAGRSHELKRQLVRGVLEASAASRSVAPGTQIYAIDPLINVVPRPGTDPVTARHHTLAQYQALDMLLGQQEPELGGDRGTIDVLGVNFYWNNQWWHPDLPAPWGREPLSMFDPHGRSFRDMLAEAHNRYGCRIFVAETSIEGRSRSAWFRYLCSEVYEAIQANIPIEGICLYPVLSHPGWDDGRYCPNGLFEMAWRGGRREVHAPLAHELRLQQDIVAGLFESGSGLLGGRSLGGADQMPNEVFATPTRA